MVEAIEHTHGTATRIGCGRSGEDDSELAGLGDLFGGFATDSRLRCRADCEQSELG